MSDNAGRHVACSPTAKESIMNALTPSPEPADRDRHGRPHEPPTPHEPSPVDLGEESVAGEEDPGAALDTSVDAVNVPTPGTVPEKDRR
jgi:hypothetical protein